MGAHCIRSGRLRGAVEGYDARVTDLPDVPDVAPTLDASEADILEQAATVDAEPADGDAAVVEGRSIEASEADILEQSQSVPSNEDDELR